MRRSAGGKDENSGPVMLTVERAGGPDLPVALLLVPPFPDVTWFSFARASVWEHLHINPQFLEMLSESPFFATQRTELKRSFFLKKKKSSFKKN